MKYLFGTFVNMLRIFNTVTQAEIIAAIDPIEKFSVVGFRKVLLFIDPSVLPCFSAGEVFAYELYEPELFCYVRLYDDYNELICIPQNNTNFIAYLTTHESQPSINLACIDFLPRSTPEWTLTR